MNNNTTKDYVSFEVAKLLKEKGFSAYCTSLYTKEGKQNDVGNYNGVDDDNYISYSKPTHALAIKWISINYGSDKVDNLKYTMSPEETNKELLNILKNC